MPKRRSSRSTERLTEKIARLKKRLRRRRSPSSSSSRSTPTPWRRGQTRSRSRSWSRSSSASYASRHSRSASPLIVIETEKDPVELEESRQTLEAAKDADKDAIVSTGRNATQITQVDEELSEEILALLGVAPVEISYGPRLLGQLSSRWQDIIKKGLNKDEKENIIKKYPAPENCKIINAPKMNPEAQAAAGDTIVNRDKAIEAKQGSVSCALTAIGLALNKLCKASGNEEVITLLCDSARLLCDYQNRESHLRKAFIISSLDNKMAREVLRDTEVDQWLFGEKLAEKLQASKAIERSSKELKGFKNKLKKPSGHLNYKGPANNTYKPRRHRQYYRKPGNSSMKPRQQKGRGRNQRQYASQQYTSRH